MPSEPALYIAELLSRLAHCGFPAPDSLQVLDWLGYESRLINELKTDPSSFGQKMSHRFPTNVW